MVAGTIKRVLQEGMELLKHSGSPSPVLDAELLLLHAYSQAQVPMNKIKLITNFNDRVPEMIYTDYLAFVKQRSAGKPIQYITGIQEFMGLELIVTENTLIPRADTEITVEKLLELSDKTRELQIIDMCTGTGAIAISLGHYLPNADVTAVDISEKALECCAQNIAKHNLQQRVATCRSNLFEGLTRAAFINNIDMIVSNPPYIPTRDIEELDVNVKEFEPTLALDGGSDGLDFYRIISKEALSYLKPDGILAFEIGYNQRQDVMNIIKESQGYYDLEVFQDLAGLDRCIIARKR